MPYLGPEWFRIEGSGAPDHHPEHAAGLNSMFGLFHGLQRCKRPVRRILRIFQALQIRHLEVTTGIKKHPTFQPSKGRSSNAISDQASLPQLWKIDLRSFDLDLPVAVLPEQTLPFRHGRTPSVAMLILTSSLK